MDANRLCKAADAAGRTIVSSCQQNSGIATNFANYAKTSKKQHISQKKQQQETTGRESSKENAASLLFSRNLLFLRSLTML